MCSSVGTIDATAERAAARLGLPKDAQRIPGPGHTVISRVGGITLGHSPACQMAVGLDARNAGRYSARA